MAAKLVQGATSARNQSEALHFELKPPLCPLRCVDLLRPPGHSLLGSNGRPGEGQKWTNTCVCVSYQFCPRFSQAKPVCCCATHKHTSTVETNWRSATGERRPRRLRGEAWLAIGWKALRARRSARVTLPASSRLRARDNFLSGRLSCAHTQPLTLGSLGRPAACDAATALAPKH